MKKIFVFLVRISLFLCQLAYAGWHNQHVFVGLHCINCVGKYAAFQAGFNHTTPPSYIWHTQEISEGSATAEHTYPDGPRSLYFYFRLRAGISNIQVKLDESCDYLGLPPILSGGTEWKKSRPLKTTLSTQALHFYITQTERLLTYKLSCGHI